MRNCIIFSLFLSVFLRHFHLDFFFGLTRHQITTAVAHSLNERQAHRKTHERCKNPGKVYTLESLDHPKKKNRKKIIDARTACDSIKMTSLLFFFLVFFFALLFSSFSFVSVGYVYENARTLVSLAHDANALLKNSTINKRVNEREANQ